MDHYIRRRRTRKGLALHGRVLPAGHGATIPFVADLNQLAARLVKQATEPDDEPAGESVAQLNGRRGGRKGGASRAASLTPEKRSEIARVAAQARWAKSRAAG